MSIPDLVPSTSLSVSRSLSASEDNKHDANQFSASPSGRKLMLQAELVAPYLRAATIDGEAGAGKQTLATFLYRCAIRTHPGVGRSGFKRCDAREWLLDATDPQAMAGFFYLDRVDLLASPGQMLLLRILKSLEARPVGGAIVVASSESSLRTLAARGQFVSDLAFRLTSVQFTVPPLRERREDIVALGTIFLDRIRRRYRLPGFTLAPDAIERLLQHDWPGNVRELSSVLESAVLRCTEGIIREADLCISFARPLIGETAKTPPATLTLNGVIRNHVRYVLELNHGNKMKAARQLGISRSTLYRMLEPEHRITA